MGASTFVAVYRFETCCNLLPWRHALGNPNLGPPRKPLGVDTGLISAIVRGVCVGCTAEQTESNASRVRHLDSSSHDPALR